MATCIPLSRGLVAAAASLALANAGAQTATTLERVTVTGRTDPVVGVGGWGDVPLSKSPFQASVIGSEQMRDAGIHRLADVTRVDPSVSDAYNAEGYWDFLSVRGYALDPRFNDRRDGLPINAETLIPLDNKDRVEILKGASGMQAGISAPGGLVNFNVKRPTTAALRSALLEWRDPGSLLGGVDISQRFGAAGMFGLRVNAAAERLDPYARDAKGHRNLLGVAADWRLAPGTLLEAEFETSHRSQPSVPGFSLLGSVPPAPADPRINLNNQPWSPPVVLDGTTASLRFSQALGTLWRWTAHAATQRLTSQDRIAFPFGCSAEGNFDRYCSDGSFDLYDYRSENERRRSDALEVALHGSLQTGAIAHALSAGVLRSQFRARFQRLAFNFVGVGNVQGTVVTPPDPSLNFDNTDRDERSTELFMRDAIHLGADSTAWLGLRHTRLGRSSVDTSGNPGPSYTQAFTTPWLALSHEFAPQQLVYASWGQGVESVVTPNLPSYGSAAGQPLPALKSRQVELGLKGRSDRAAWTAAWFDIDRPATNDTGNSFSIDGSARHRGVEAAVETEFDAWNFTASAMLLDAQRRGAQASAVNGLRPTNVPRRTLKLQTRYRVAAVPGLSVGGNLLNVGDRMVLPDNSVAIPGYTRVDASARYDRRVGGGATLTWRAGIDNLFDRRAWKESPYQFGHVYLFPLAPRTLRLSVEAAL